MLLRGFDALPPLFSLTDISLVLSIIEHIDPFRYKNCPPGEEATLVSEVLARHRRQQGKGVCL